MKVVDVITRTVLGDPQNLVSVECQYQACLLLPALVLPRKPQHVNLALSSPAAGMTPFGAAASAVFNAAALLVGGATAVVTVGPVESCAGSISEAAGMLWPAKACQECQETVTVYVQRQECQQSWHVMLAKATTCCHSDCHHNNIALTMVSLCTICIRNLWFSSNGCRTQGVMAA